ncbi:MAG: hypothetical protein LBD60_01745 [Puniceicoccales bacterium]|nr:hypothetical protein [Puniceicoccales bacterium]
MPKGNLFRNIDVNDDITNEMFHTPLNLATDLETAQMLIRAGAGPLDK